MQRAKDLVSKMTLDEKMSLVQSQCYFAPLMAPGDKIPPDFAQSFGYVHAIPRLGIPSQNQNDAGLGIGADTATEPRDVTAFPSTVLAAAGWSTGLSEQSGLAIGVEARANGISVMLAGGCNLAREPRCGRNFEYYGEDPLLSGHMAGAAIKGIQSQRIVSTVKHFALNSQETYRFTVNETLAEDAMRESDLLAFQLAIEIGQPGSVMNAYNKYNGAWCSENEFLLTKVLKTDWKYPGWVMSDWGSVHSTREAAMAGLDVQSGHQFDTQRFFGAPLRELVESDPAVAARLDDMVTRVLYGAIAVGVMDDPPKLGGKFDNAAHATLAQTVAEEGIVLLRNSNNLLPLSASTRTIAVIGPGADIGVLSGGGSSNVKTPGTVERPAPIQPFPGIMMCYHPSPPFQAIKARLADGAVKFNNGEDVDAAAKLAGQCDVAIVFAEQWTSEFVDVPSLALPGNQNQLVAAVARANPKTVVVLETGGAVLTPWVDEVGAVLAAFYPGHRGGEAIARILFGDVNPSGRLPLTFPLSEQDLPNPVIPGYPPSKDFPMFSGPDISKQHPEGADVGYRWFERTGKPVRFPFGFGLSYTTFALSDLQVSADKDVAIKVKVTNTGARGGKQVVQVYARPPVANATRRLVAFAKVDLAPGQSEVVSMRAEPRSLARFDVQANVWRIAEGDYEITVGASSADAAQQATARLGARDLPA